MEEPKTYNLLLEPWIPVLWNDGRFGRVNIKDALLHARRIRQIAASNPMDNVALLRLLLAVLQFPRGRRGEPRRQPTPQTDREEGRCHGLL